MFRSPQQNVPPEVGGEVGLSVAALVGGGVGAFDGGAVVGLEVG